MDLRGEECRLLLGEESFKSLQLWLSSCNTGTDEENTYGIKDEKGELIAEFKASPATAGTVAMLLEQAARTQTAKLAAWMIAHSFTTGKGDSMEDLLKELTWQVNLLRDSSYGL